MHCSSRAKRWSCQITPVLLSPCSATSSWEKAKWCHLKVVKTMSQYHHCLKTIRCWQPEALPWDINSSAQQLHYWKGKMRLHYMCVHGFNLPYKQRGGDFSHSASTIPVTCVFPSRLQTAPVSQSAHWERPWLWLWVVRAESFKQQQVMKMEKAEKYRLDSLADVWCCISRWPKPSFSGKGPWYGSTIPVFPTGLWFVF